MTVFDNLEKRLWDEEEGVTMRVRIWTHAVYLCVERSLDLQGHQAAQCQYADLVRE